MPIAPSPQSTAKNTVTASTFKPRVRRLGQGRYLVESASRPGVGHPVTVERCNCKGYAYRGTCRHVALVQAIEPRMQAWYGQVAPATALDAEIAQAEQLLARKRRALADAHPQDDRYATLLREVDQAERQVAALNYSAMRAA